MAYKAPDVQNPSGLAANAARSLTSMGNATPGRNNAINSAMNAAQSMTPMGRATVAKNNSKNKKGSKSKNDKGGGLKKYLAGDDVFQNTRTDLRKNFQLAREATRTNERNVLADYETLVKRMQQQQGIDQRRLTDDYAARGLLGSGLSLQADELLEGNYSDQFTDAETSKNRSLAQLAQDLKSAKTLRDQQIQDARLNAIRRRAERYGIT